MSAVADVLTSLGGASAIALAASKVWQWWAARDAAKLAAETDAAKADAASRSAERTDIVSVLREQAASAEKRATDAAEGRLRVAEGLTSAGAAMRDLAAGVDRAADAIEDHDRREADSQARVDTQLARVLALLEELVAHQRGTGEHRVSVTPRGGA